MNLVNLRRACALSIFPLIFVSTFSKKSIVQPRLRRFARCVLLVLVSLIVCSPAAAQRYSVTDIGVTGDDRTYFRAPDINDRGQVAGTMLTPGGSLRAFIWDSTGGLRTISPANSDEPTEAFDINNHGQVIGRLTLPGIDCFPVDCFYQCHAAFIWDGENGMRRLGTLGGSTSQPRSINNHGQVIGTSSLASTSGDGCEYDTRRFIWDSANGMREFINGSRDINDSGQVAGQENLSSDYDDRAYIWDSVNGFRFPNMPEGVSTYANAINNRGHIAGWSNTYDASGWQHNSGIIWDGVTQVRDLGKLNDWDTRAYAINGNDRVVGVAEAPDGERAFIWDETGGMRDLNSLIPPDSGWILMRATAINKLGQIVGHGTYEGERRVFLLTPEAEPLIFVPGIGGSVLKGAAGDGSLSNTLFPSVYLSDLDTLSLRPRPNGQAMPTVIAADVLRELKLPLLPAVPIYDPLLDALVTEGGFKEYAVDGKPVRRTTSGCDYDNGTQNGIKPTLFVFAYDWRLGNAENTVKLKDYIGCVQKFHPDSKVNILAHSMGGLLARRYILDNPTDHNISKFVTVGSPWLGAPKAVDVLERGKFFDLTGIPLIGEKLDKLAARRIKEVVPYFKSANELLPSKWYYDLGGVPFVELLPDGQRLSGYNRLVNIINGDFPLTTPMTTNSVFHQKFGQDDWKGDGGPIGQIKYLHIWSKQSTPNTLGTVIGVRARGTRRLIYDEELYEETDGDGTVPVLSSSRIREPAEFNYDEPLSNYNNPYAQLEQFENRLTKNDPAFSDAEKGTSHMAFTGSKHVKDLVFEFLKIVPTTPPTTASRLSTLVKAKFADTLITPHTTSPQRNNLMTSESRRGDEEGQSELQTESLPRINRRPFTLSGELSEPLPPGTPTSSVEGYYLLISGTEDIDDITDDEGNGMVPVGDIGHAILVPGVKYDRAGDISHFISMYQNSYVTIKFRTLEEIKIDFVRGVGNTNPSLAVRYKDIELLAGTKAMLKVTPQGLENLRLDIDGDGVFETIIPPTVTATGTDARDVTPPAVQIQVARQPTGTAATVSITAQDSETGVRNIRYWLSDDDLPKTYTGPFTIDTVATPKVYADADDNVANRSSIISQHTTANVTLVPIADAYVKGSTPDVNFGASTELQVKRTLNPGTGKGRQAYLRFDTSSVTGNVSRAVLRVYGNLNATIGANNNLPCAVFPVSAVWDETTIVWNNKPAPNVPQELGRVIVTDTTARWYEFDITAFINAERAAGRSLTGVLLRNMEEGEPGDYFTVFNSREATENRPQLVIEK